MTRPSISLWFIFVLVALSLAVLGACAGSDAQGSLAEYDADGGVADRLDGPRDECGNGMDDDGDGVIDEGCYCGSGETQSCFSGTYPTRLVGACADGVQVCDVSPGEFGFWGECSGDTLPRDETCDGTDADCDGAVDEGCPCTAGETNPCGAEFVVEPCTGGVQTCSAEGIWGSCEGAVGPSAELCGDDVDNDCDGARDEGCDCVPSPEICADGIDNDCDGVADEASCRAPSADAGIGRMDPPVECPLPAATGSEWTVSFSSVPDDSARLGAMIRPKGSAVDGAGTLFVTGEICDGSVTILGTTVDSGPAAYYPILTCNVWVASLRPDGTPNFVWSPELLDIAMPTAVHTGPFAYTDNIAPDNAGGAWVGGKFAGRYSPRSGSDYEQETLPGLRDIFFVHLDASGTVVEDFVISEPSLALELLDFTVDPSGDLVITMQASAPLFEVGGEVVRTGSSGFAVISFDPSTETANWVTTAQEDNSRAQLHPGGLSITSAGEILIAGGSNGDVHLGAAALASPDRDRGHTWLWTLNPTTGGISDLQTWHADVGYYAHAWQANRTADGTAMLGTIRGTIDHGVGSIGMGTGDPSDPTSPTFTTFDAGRTVSSARAFVPAPFDAYHALRLAADWNGCSDTVSGSVGVNTLGATTTIDLGAGAMSVPRDTLNVAVYDSEGTLGTFTTRPLGNAYEQLRSVSVARHERAMYVTFSNNNTHTGRIQRINY